MHIYLNLRPFNTLVLPISYNNIIQAAIYNAIEPRLAEFLHESGFDGGGRKFKLFSFSRLLGRFQFDKQNNTISFDNSNLIKLVFSSPLNRFCQSVANGMLIKGNIKLSNSEINVKSMTAKQYKADGESVVLKTLSPIVAYSTFLRPDGRKYTCYFQPGDPEYDSLIENNLRKKHKAFYGTKAPSGEVHVKKIGQMEQNLVNYKGTIIKGYSGKIVLTGPNELLQMAIDAGVGSKNGQGFGCVEVS